MPPSEQQGHRPLRQSILEHLYRCFQSHPLAAIELRQLAESCDVTAQELNWNIVYLEKKGWIRLNYSSECQPFVACSAELTGPGIDLVEDPEAMNKLFAQMLQTICPTPRRP